MGGSKAGGKKAAAKLKAYNPNFYRDIGRIGGRNGHTGGFYNNPERARELGTKGGKMGKRGPWTEKDRAARPVKQPPIPKESFILKVKRLWKTRNI